MMNKIEAKSLKSCVKSLTRKRTAYVTELTEGQTVSTFGTWWDGGSRAEFWLVNLVSGQRTRPSYSTNPPEYGGEVKGLRPESGFALVRGGVVQGKDATIHVYHLPGDKVTV